MDIKDFDYHLPEGFIAQEPCTERDHSRLMIVDRTRNTVECGHFLDLPRFFEPGDTLVLNDSRVVPAKLRGRKKTGAVIELLLLGTHDASLKRREALLRPAKRVSVGTRISFDSGSWAEILTRLSEKKWLVEFHPEGDFDDFLEREGEAPLPPYIKRKAGDSSAALDRARYQTVYAKHPGSVAAPTAGLHFSDGILDTLRNKGIEIVTVTLHVGYGTFLPIETARVEDHRMEEERFIISADAAERINNAARITATGTTSVRALESSCGGDGRIRAGEGCTDLFIYPGYRFRKVDRLLTNFHLPMSSLFLLAAAFAGKDLLMKAYDTAQKEGFRFYSYGDCMLIV